MKILAAFLIVLVPSLASKEYADDISQLLDNPDLILELVKRLGSDKASSLPQKHSFTVPDKHSKNGHIPYVPIVRGDSRSCKIRQFKMTIIRTDDSRNAGATFLSFTENVASNADCLSKCCSKKGCDLAVYENKTKHNCYLFKCQDDVTGENKCVFDTHADYISTTLTTANGDVGSPTAVDNTETSAGQEKGDEDSLGSDLEKVTVESKPVPPQHKATPRPTQLPHSVALGHSCRLDVSCEDPHAVCFQDKCQCQQHYQQKKGICREICGEDHVACGRRGTASIGPDCIPKIQVCDGTTQCADGSDERECKGYPGGSPPSNPAAQAPDNWEEKPNVGKDGDSTSSEDRLHSVSEDKSTNSDNEPAVSANNEPVVSKDKTDESPKVDEKPDTDESKEMKEGKTQNTSKSNEPVQPAGNVQSPAPVEVASTTVPPPVKVQVVNEEEEVFVTKEKVIVTSPTDGAQGPIVALSLGLAITLMLLIFVGCRLRNVRHRLRKGRPLHSNEADYLINGMYL